MQKVIIELTDIDSLKALEELEHRRLIRIINKPNLISYAVPGQSISEEDFKKWVESAEGSPAVSISEAKQRWATQKEKLKNLIR